MTDESPALRHEGYLLVINGPNLGRLGARQPAIYGTTTLSELEADLAGQVGRHGYDLRCEQHDCEGRLVQVVHAHGACAGAIINPGALMTAGWSLRDALEHFPAPWIEVHISNIWARESFRHVSVLSPLASGVICGLGVDGYRLAADALLRLLGQPPAPLSTAAGQSGPRT